VLIYSGTLNQTLVANALRARPHGFVHKEDSLPSLLEALRTVAQGGSYLTPFATALAEQAENASPVTKLSPRERTVLQLVAEGCSSKQIGDRLGISAKTVEHHRTALMQKLDVHDVASLTRLAVREGLVRND
jgi:DNA-binding NarL/FixJ family response regulator